MFDSSSQQPAAGQPTENGLGLFMIVVLVGGLCVLLLLVAWPALLLAFLVAIVLKERSSRLITASLVIGSLLSIGLVALLLPLLLPQLRALIQALAASDGKPALVWQGAHTALVFLWLRSLILAPIIIGAFRLIRFRDTRSEVEQAEARRAEERAWDEGRARERAQRLITKKKVPAVLKGEPVLGCVISGDLTAWTEESLLRLPLRELLAGTIVAGLPGRGKSETILRLCWSVVQAFKTKVLFFDGKGDYAFAARFVAAMRQAGCARVGIFPASPINGWMGSAAEIYNRLVAMQQFSEPFYEAQTKYVLGLVIHAPGGPPMTTAAFLGRLNKKVLEKLYKGHPRQAEVGEVAKGAIEAVSERYHAFFDPLGDLLDGTATFDDYDAIAITLDGEALGEETASVGRFLLQLFRQYAAGRVDRTTWLCVVDEYGAFEDGAKGAEMFERMRFHGVGLVVTAQSEETLGRQAERMMGAAATYILHRGPALDGFIRRAGMVESTSWSIQVEARGVTGRETANRKREYRVDPEIVRSLAVGECVVIHGGRAALICVPQVLVERAALRESDQLAREAKDHTHQAMAPGAVYTLVEEADDDEAAPALVMTQD